MYGKEVFIVSLLHECSLIEIDSAERKFIQEKGTLYPNGYNLTLGGKGARSIKTDNDVEALQPSTPQKRGGCKDRTAETRSKISDAHKKLSEKSSVKLGRMKNAQTQHTAQKYERFEGVKLDITNLDQYIHERRASYVVKINNIQTHCVGKYEKKEILRERAREFLKQIAQLAMLPNCSGKS